MHKFKKFRFNINTSNVNNMSKMFFQCNSLINLTFIDNCNNTTISNNDNSDFIYQKQNTNNGNIFSTSKVKDMSFMFFECKSLKKLDLSCFKTNNVDNMESMFYKCLSLINLNLSNFQVKNSTNLSDIFNGINKECKISCNDKRINKKKDECLIF